MITLDDYINLGLSRLSADFVQWLTTRFASDALVDIQSRVQGTGYNAYGDKFKPYSKRYAKWREEKGYQTAHKDFTFTTAMWASIHVIGTVEHYPGYYVTTVGTKTPRSIGIMEKIKQREHVDLLKLTFQEEQKLTKRLEDKIHEILTR